ncbi:relaxase/mobilization nuclease domain-containing protein [Candidatus Clostridium radicumherbarum]|uniref:Relaxase/mobilization nuclease domain-containing protein n=1 Tax=Candidatus Clostridium radicumherbarum TaxID=3381662 RepID=A0ABW8TVM2_9CLOT
MASIKSLSSKSPVSKIVKYVTNPKKTNEELISGVNCSPENVKDEMNYTKTHYHKKNGVQYFHVIQSFKPGEVDPKKAHAIGTELASKIAPYHECLVVTHTDKNHIHNHIVINSVSYKNGKKYQVENGAYKIKKESDKICERENLSVIENKKKAEKDKGTAKVKGMSNNEYRAAINKDTPWWKGQIIIDIKQSQLKCKTKEDFIKDMESKGYKVNWSDTRKYITYTTPDGKKIRDNKLHDGTLLKEVMESGFKRVTKEQYDRGAERNISGITRAAEPGIIASATNRAIEGSKQKSSGAESSISKPTGADLYTELSKQGAIKGANNINRESGGSSRTDIKGSGRAGEQLQKHSIRANAADGQVYEVSSQGGTTRGLQESSEARETKTNTNGQSNNNNDRSISNSNNMSANDISNNLSKEVENKKNLGLER